MMPQGPIQLTLLLTYAIYVLLGIVCIGAIVRSLWSPLDVFRAPSCGGCGHGVRDFLQGVCPECGGSYAKVGISTPGMAIRMRGSLPIALLAWTTLVVTAASYTHGWLEQRAWARYSLAMTSFSSTPGPVQESYTADLAPARPFNARPSQSEKGDEDTYRINLSLTYITDGTKVQSGMCTMKLRRNGEPESFPLTIDLTDGAFTIKDGADKEIAKGGKNDKVDDAAVEKWFKAAGLDTTNSGVKRSMKDAARIARFAKADPAAIQSAFEGSSFGNDARGVLQVHGSSSSSGGAPLGAMPAAMPGPPGVSTAELATSMGALGTLYLLGCGGIVWRNRRMVRR